MYKTVTQTMQAWQICMQCNGNAIIGRYYIGHNHLVKISYIPLKFNNVLIIELEHNTIRNNTYLQVAIKSATLISEFFQGKQIVLRFFWACNRDKFK